MKPKGVINTIVALRNEKGSYNITALFARVLRIVALRNEKGSYNSCKPKSTQQ